MSLSEYPCPLGGLGSLIQVLGVCLFLCVAGRGRGILEDKENSREIIRKRRHQRKAGLSRLLLLETAFLNYSEPLTQ